MRTARFLLLIVYVAGHTGLPLPLPAGACVAGACGCGDACQCAQETIAAGDCCCSAGVQRSTVAASSCCAAKSETACSSDTDSAESDPVCKAGTQTVTTEPVASAKAGACCQAQEPGGCSGDERSPTPVLLPCGCQQEAPEGIAACSDPRLLSEAVGPPRDRCDGWCAPAPGPAAPRQVHAPDDPVPRLIA